MTSFLFILDNSWGVRIDGSTSEAGMSEENVEGEGESRGKAIPGWPGIYGGESTPMPPMRGALKTDMPGEGVSLAITSTGAI